MIDEKRELLANLFCRNRQNGSISDLPFNLLRNEEDAWSVQATANFAFANDALGYAIVGSSSDIRRSLGISSPIYSTIPIGTYHQSSHSPYRLPEGFIGAQCELVFTMGTSLGADHRPVTREQFCKAVLSYQPAIGLVGRRGHLTAQPHLAAIADFAFHVATLAGRHHETTDLEPLDMICLRASINGDQVFQAVSGEKLADPIDSALWLVNDLVTRASYLSAGDIIATGSILPILLQIVPGQELKVEISGIGEVAASFV